MSVLLPLPCKTVTVPFLNAQDGLWVMTDKHIPQITFIRRDRTGSGIAETQLDVDWMEEARVLLTVGRVLTDDGWVSCWSNRVVVDAHGIDTVYFYE